MSAAQEIKPQARVLAADRGIDCLTVDYAVLKGTDDPTQRLVYGRVGRQCALRASSGPEN